MDPSQLLLIPHSSILFLDVLKSLTFRQVPECGPPWQGSVDLNSYFTPPWNINDSYLTLPSNLPSDHSSFFHDDVFLCPVTSLPAPTTLASSLQRALPTKAALSKTSTKQEVEIPNPGPSTPVCQKGEAPFSLGKMSSLFLSSLPFHILHGLYVLNMSLLATE